MAQQLNERIARDLQVCGGEPVFKGTRVLLRTVPASLADGDASDQIIPTFPSLNREVVQAVALPTE